MQNVCRCMKMDVGLPCESIGTEDDFFFANFNLYFL